MRDPDTSMGGGDRGFPSTTWSVPALLQDRARLEEFCRRFWKPVYSYARVAWGKRNDDAKDVTQAFFLWLVEGDALSKFQPACGSFRSYLKLLLRNFLYTREEATARLKRGGGATFVPISEDLAPDSDDPEKAFDRAWMTEVLRRAIERTRRRFEGRQAMFRVFEEYELSGANRSYGEVAAKLGLKESDVRNHLVAVRKELRAEVMAELGETVDGDPAAEYDALFG